MKLWDKAKKFYKEHKHRIMTNILGGENMGLDMYLIKRPNWGKNEKQKDAIIEILKKYPISSFDKEVAYWRKANAIHKWFVDNVQDGVDDCQEHRPVTKDDLFKLKKLCDEVLKDHSLADKLLPTFGGFFFGSLDYDEDDYFAKIKYTAEICKELTDDDGFDFENYDLYYWSSW